MTAPPKLRDSSSSDSTYQEGQDAISIDPALLSDLEEEEQKESDKKDRALESIKPYLELEQSSIWKSEEQISYIAHLIKLVEKESDGPEEIEQICSVYGLKLTKTGQINR